MRTDRKLQKLKYFFKQIVCEQKYRVQRKYLSRVKQTPRYIDGFAIFKNARQNKQQNQKTTTNINYI